MLFPVGGGYGYGGSGAMAAVVVLSSIYLSTIVNIAT
jgi:pantoate kinase